MGVHWTCPAERPPVLFVIHHMCHGVLVVDLPAVFQPDNHSDNACTNHPATTRRVGLVRLWLPSFEGSANHSRPCQIGSGRQVPRVAGGNECGGACMQQCRLPSRGILPFSPWHSVHVCPMPAHQAACIRAAGGSHSSSQRSQARPAVLQPPVSICAGWNPVSMGCCQSTFGFCRVASFLVVVGVLALGESRWTGLLVCSTYGRNRRCSWHRSNVWMLCICYPHVPAVLLSYTCFINSAVWTCTNPPPCNHSFCLVGPVVVPPWSWQGSALRSRTLPRFCTTPQLFAIACHPLGRRSATAICAHCDVLHRCPAAFCACECAGGCLSSFPCNAAGVAGPQLERYLFKQHPRRSGPPGHTRVCVHC